VTTSLLEAMIGMLDFQAARFLIEGEVPGQEGNHHPTLAPMGVFPTADGHINIAASSGAQFRTLLEVLGEPALAQRPEYADTRLRSRNRESLNAAIGELTRRKPSAEWIEVLNARGIPSGPINRIDEAMRDPQVVHLGIATPVDHPTLGRINLVGQPVHLHRTPQRMRRATPERGGDTAAVLREIGYDDDAIAQLRNEGVL
jgi:formyl-CoA transferase